MLKDVHIETEAKPVPSALPMATLYQTRMYCLFGVGCLGPGTKCILLKVVGESPEAAVTGDSKNSSLSKRSCMNWAVKETGVALQNSFLPKAS